MKINYFTKEKKDHYTRIKGFSAFKKKKKKDILKFRSSILLR